MSLIPQPPASPKAPMSEETPDVSRLYRALKQIESTPNIITRAGFRRFEPLFRREPGLSDAQLAELGKEFRGSFDFYKATNIVVSETDPTVVLTLPAIFTPMRSLSGTPEHDMLVAANSKRTHGAPVHAATAFGRMADALFAEQVNNRTTVEEYKAAYVAAMKQIVAAYHNQPNIPLAQQEAESDHAGDMINSAEWAFE
jgi:hypothetical protein